MKSVIIASTLALAGFASPLAAQSTYEAAKVVDAVNIADVTAIAESLGHKATPLENLPDMVRMKAEGYPGYVLQVKVCKQEGNNECKGVLIFSVFNDLSDVTDEQINEANNRSLPVKVSRNAKTRYLVFRRYLILDHGVTMRNLRGNIAGFLGASRNVIKLLKGENQKSKQGS